MVVLQAGDPIEAIRLRAQRLWVIRHGKVIAETPPQIATLAIAGRPHRLDPACIQGVGYSGPTAGGGLSNLN
jgi:cytosine deaminase